MKMFKMVFNKLMWIPAIAMFGFCFMQNPLMSQTEPDYSSLKIVPPPNGGIYLGQYEWLPGDVETFETAIGRKTAWWSKYGVMEPDANGFPVFDFQNAELAWQAGKVVLVNAIEAYPNPDDNSVTGFTVDKLLNGEYDIQLKQLAEQFRQFGKPMFFHTAREPLGIGLDYMGGFGPEGDKSTLWALQNKKGFKEFEPSSFPNAQLYADLGDSTVSDGIERLKAAQRYYYHFFVEQEGLALTFDTMGWPVGASPQSVESEIENWVADYPSLDPQHTRALFESSFDFAQFYPGDDYVDWVSINYYTLDFYAENWPGLEQDFLVATIKYLNDLDYTMSRVREVAPGKPVFFLELGFPDGMKENSARAASRIDSTFSHILANYPEINGISMWSFHPSWQDIFPFQCLIKPNTQQAAAFRQVIDENPGYFHSCVYFSDGSQMPTCSDPTGVRDERQGVPEDFQLLQNYPNPFNPGTTIRYRLPTARAVTLTIYNPLGQKVRTLVKSNQTAGRYLVSWDGRNDLGQKLSSGVYFYTLKFGARVTATRKMLYLQ